MISERLADLPPECRERLLELLDELTRPLSPRELERALFATDLGATDRKRVVAAVKGRVVLVVRKDLQ